MQGYMTILSEAWEIGQFDNPNNCPTHVFLQVGVGSFSGGLSGYLVNQMKVKNSKIKIITVEPREADCVYRSHQHGDLHGKLHDAHITLCTLKSSKKVQFMELCKHTSYTHYFQHTLCPLPKSFKKMSLMIATNSQPPKSRFSLKKFLERYFIILVQ